MRAWIVGVAVAASLGVSGFAVSQTDVIAERRNGMREMGRHLEAIQGILQSRGDQRPIAGRADQIIAFYANLNAIYPAPSLTPPVAEGRNDGQTRALAVIEPNRAAFQALASSMVTQLTVMKAAAEAGNVTPDMLRQAGTICGDCHQRFRSR